MNEKTRRTNEAKAEARTLFQLSRVDPSAEGLAAADEVVHSMNTNHQRKVLISISHLLVLASLLSLSLPVSAQVVVGQEDIIESIHCFIAGESKQLILTKQEADPPAQNKKPDLYTRLVYFRLKKYSMTNGQPKDKADEIVWQDFDQYSPSFMPNPTWSSTVIYRRGRAYVMIVKCIPTLSLDIHLYVVNPSSPSKAELPVFDQEGTVVSPEVPPEKPFANFKKRLQITEGGISAVRLEETDDQLILFLERDFRQMSTPHQWTTICLRFNRKTKEWFELDLTSDGRKVNAPQ